MAIILKTGSSYTFTTIQANLLGGTFEKVKLGGIVDYTTAKILNPNIDSIQASVLPYLPPTASIKHTTYKYYSFTKQTGGVIVFAAEWINEDSLIENTVEFLDIRISGANASDIPAIKNILGLSGWSVVNEVK